jgi:small GTP-binding protein
MASSVFLPPSQTRLVTICAHVDHGKTTLADNLIEANGLISERLAGTLRYLDSSEEEQRRGITMRASAIGLRHNYIVKKKKDDAASSSSSSSTPIVVHLLDSPGHMDFSTEVSSSLQCCDGCILVVDAVEGMCARTHQVVREAHHHQLVPILVINKVDRLCTNLCLSPNEAYLRLRSLVESINATCSAMVTSSLVGSNTPDEKVIEQWTFDPTKGNVVFASALYGWGFAVPSLARSLFREKVLPIKPAILKQYLFGDFKYKNGKVLKWKNDSDEPTLFAEYGLASLWELYEGIAGAAAASGAGTNLFADGRIPNSQKTTANAKISASTPGMEAVLHTLQLGNTGHQPPPSHMDQLGQVLTRTGASTEDAVIRSILRRYRPLSEAILDTVYEVCPSPSEAAKTIRPRALAFTPPHPEAFLPIQTAVQDCNFSDNAPAVAHVCKFMATDTSHIRDPHLESQQDTIILGLARILSGRLKTGNEYFVMGPKHKPGQSAPKRAIRLYLIMGSSFVLVNEVPAGHLCAIQNLEDVQLKTATLCDSPHGRPLQGFDRGIRPLVKVNVESVDPSDTALLERGLVKLSLADAAVEVVATAKGERLLACLGELHLEQSILDLKKIYCGKESIQLRISDPIVEFGETTEWFENETVDFASFWNSSLVACPVRQATIPPYNEEEGIEYAHHGRCRSVLTGRLAAVSLRAVPLKDAVFQAMKAKTVLEESIEDLQLLGKALGMLENTPGEILGALLESVCSIDEGGSALIESASLRSGATICGVESETGQVHVPTKSNVVIGTTEDYEEDGSKKVVDLEGGLSEYSAMQDKIRTLGFSLEAHSQEIHPPGSLEANEAAADIWKSQMHGSLSAGFGVALRAGPICEEPVRGVLVVLEGVEVAVARTESGYKPTKALSGGMVVAALNTGIRCALL